MTDIATESKVLSTEAGGVVESKQKTPKPVLTKEKEQWISRLKDKLNHIFDGTKGEDPARDVLQEVAEKSEELVQEQDSSEPVAIQEVEISSTRPESQEALPPYVSDTLNRVEGNSREELESFMNGEEIVYALKSALTDVSQLETIIEMYPEKEQDALRLMPNSEERRRANVEKGDWTAAMKSTPGEKERSKLVEWARSWGKRKEFDARVEEKKNSKAKALMEKAREDAEKYNGGGDVLVISARTESVLELLKGGKYLPLLDNVEFQGSEKESISKMLTLDSKGGEYAMEYRNLGKIGQRYIRETELGIYSCDELAEAIPHPVYGQMIADEERELQRAVQEGYGTVHIKFKTDSIKDRTTFAVGDTINDKESFNQQLTWREAAKARVFLNSLISDERVDWRDLPPYIEAHMMGGVNIEDVEEIVFDTEAKTKKLEDFLDKNQDTYEVSIVNGDRKRIRLKKQE